MLKRLWPSFSNIKSLLLFIIYHHLLATLGTTVGLVFIIIMISLIIYGYPGLAYLIEGWLGFTLFSVQYFTILLLISLIGIVLSFFFTIRLGFPLARFIKRSLESIADAVEAITRGKLHHRLHIEGEHEIAQVGKQFNRMADKLEQQVSSLQSLVNKNSILLNQAEQAASLDERRRLARELHDAVSQQLFAISMNMASLPKLMDRSPQEAKQNFQQVERMVHLTQQELRALIMHLRPVTLEGVPLQKGLENLLQDLKQNNDSLTIHWHIDPITAIEQGIEDQVFRVVQEAISNILRHANATKIQLTLMANKERLLLQIEDDGLGFEVSKIKKSSYGLSTMKERVETIGGRLDIISIPDIGTRLEIRVPIKVKEADYSNDRNEEN